MRDELRGLEGQKVHFIGRLKEWRLNSDGTARVCMAAVEIRPLDPTRSLKETPAVRVDHFWQLNVPADSMGSKKMLHKMAGVGTITWYSRADGSVDLGVKGGNSISLHTLLRKAGIQDADGPAELLNCITWMEEALEKIDRGTPCYAWDVPTEQALRDVRRVVEKLRRDCAAEMKAYAGALVRYPKPKKLDLLPLRNCRRSAAKGVA